MSEGPSVVVSHLSSPARKESSVDRSSRQSLSDFSNAGEPVMESEVMGAISDYGTSGYDLSCEQRKRRTTMLRWTIIFIIVAIIAELFGLSGVAGEAAWIAHVLFVIFLVLFIVSLIFRGGRPPTV
jgi:uncharacterized membrane protein YtjA (UPF0391 family)